MHDELCNGEVPGPTAALYIPLVPLSPGPVTAGVIRNNTYVVSNQAKQLNAMVRPCI